MPVERRKVPGGTAEMHPYWNPARLKGRRAERDLLARARDDH
jgi:hypothetical protein